MMSRSTIRTRLLLPILGSLALSSGAIALLRLVLHPGMLPESLLSGISITLPFAATGLAAWWSIRRFEARYPRDVQAPASASGTGGPGSRGDGPAEANPGFGALTGGRSIDGSESALLMEGILSSMSCGVVLLDLDGRVRLMNRQGARMLCCEGAPVVGRLVTDIAPETVEFLDAQAGLYREVELVRSDGSLFPIGYSSSFFIGREEKPSGVIVVYQDLTKLKALQTKAMDKERFAAIGRIVAGVAHEIKNPLFGISSIAQIFERELINPIHRELAHALLTEARRLNRLVDDLLVYGRPLKLACERCNLSRLLEEVFEMHRTEINGQKIRVRDEHIVPKISAFVDPNQIRQVFLNLLRNALEASPPGGEISISLLLEDRFIVFTIADQGPGIPAEHLGRVFDLFFTTKPKGTGLGLPICRKIVQDHGGELAVDSQVGLGTAVTVKLPYRGVCDEPAEKRG